MKGLCQHDIEKECIEGLKAMSTKPKRKPPPPKTKQYFEKRKFHRMPDGTLMAGSKHPTSKKKSKTSYNYGKTTKNKRGQY